jgi:endonuclease III
MKKNTFVQKILNDHFPNPTIPLLFTSPYTLLVATLLSAQTTDKQVNRVTLKLFAKASSPQEMILLTPEEIQTLIASCGLAPSKAKNIWHLSKILIDRYAGKVPSSFIDLESLPGVGHKTASVVMAQGFGKKAFPVDTHIFRCARRWGLSKGKTVLQVEADLKKKFPKKIWAKIHLQIIYFARTFCKARNIYCSCPLCAFFKKQKMV